MGRGGGTFEWCMADGSSDVAVCRSANWSSNCSFVRQFVFLRSVHSFSSAPLNALQLGPWGLSCGDLWGVALLKWLHLSSRYPPFFRPRLQTEGRTWSSLKACFIRTERLKFAGSWTTPRHLYFIYDISDVRPERTEYCACPLADCYRRFGLHI